MSDLERFGDHVGGARLLESYGYRCPRCGAAKAGMANHCVDCTEVVAAQIRAVYQTYSRQVAADIIRASGGVPDAGH